MLLRTQEFYSHICLLTHDYCKMQWIRWKWYHYWNARSLPPPALFAVLSLTVRISLSYWNSFSFILHPAIEPVMRNVSNSHRFRLSFFFTKTVLMRKLIMLKSGLLLGGVIKCQSLKSSCTWNLATQMFYAAWHHRSAECTFHHWCSL